MPFVYAETSALADGVKRSSASHTTGDGQRDQGAEAIQTAPAASKGVKFQDGLSPGQGNDGETIIPGVDKHNTSIRATDPDNQPSRQESKHRNLIERTTWTFIMIAGFIGALLCNYRLARNLIPSSLVVLLCMGHPYMILLVMLCQTLVYKEVTALFQLSNRMSAQLKISANIAR